MKILLCIVSFCISFAICVEIIPKTLTREIRADVLRGIYIHTCGILQGGTFLKNCIDFPGVCYASTQCRTFKEGEEWDLKPFCGKSVCIKGADGM